MASIVCSSISSEKTSTTSTSSIAEAGSSASVEAVRGRNGGYNYTDPKLAFPHSSSFAGQGSNKAFTKAALAASTSQSANSLRGAADSADISSLRKDTTKSTTSTSAVISHSSAASTPLAASFKAVTKSNSEAKTKPEAAKAVPSASLKNVSPVKARKGPPPPPKV